MYFVNCAFREKKNQFLKVAKMTSLSGHLLGTELVVKTTSGESLRGDLFWYVWS